jgi:hypothetical protein
MNMPGMRMTMRDLPSGARVDPHLTMRVPVLTPGLYELWLQFRGGERLYVAAFVLRAA